MEQLSVPFIPSDDSAEVLEPANGSFNLPTSAVAAELSSVLRRRTTPSSSVRTNQFDAALFQAVPQGLTVRRFVIDESTWPAVAHSMIQEWLDQFHFVGTGAGNLSTERQSITIDEDHDLSPLAAFGLTNAFSPFFADENVPSAMVSSQSRRPLRSSLFSNRFQAWSQTPDSVHCWCRRQQVAGEGKCGGRSFQRAPVRKIHRIPSTHSRGGMRGLPPSGDGGSSENRSAINNHCSSVSCAGSFLEPVGTEAAPVLRIRDIINLLGRNTIRNQGTTRLASKSMF